MNKLRRKKIEEVRIAIQDQIEILQSLQEEEQEYFDNMPENLQSSEKGEEAERTADDLQNIIDEIIIQLDEIDNIIYT